MKKRCNQKVILLAAILAIFIILIAFFINKKYFTGFSVFNPLFLLSSAGRLFINLGYYVNIHNPQNISYNFSVGSNYTLDLNVSSNRNITVWKYTLEDMRHNATINDSIIFSPNTTIRAARWNNRITIFANDSGGNLKNESIEFFVYVPNSAPIIGQVSNAYACERNYLLYYFNVTDIDEDTPFCALSSSNIIYVTFSTNINLTTNRYELFSGVLSKSNAGGINAGFKIYNMTIYCIDNQYVDSKNINITVIETNNAPVIQPINNTIVWTSGNDSSFYYQINASDIEDGDQNSLNLTFNISFSGSYLFNISLNGTMRFSPNASQNGAYNITVCAMDSGLSNPHENISLCGQDGSNLTTCTQFLLNVSERSVIILSPAESGGGGGGGGGGSSAVKNCTEKWGCSGWGDCMKLDENYKSGDFNFNTYSVLRNNCTLNKLDESVCGYQKRECFELNNCSMNKSRPSFIQLCYYSENASCNDGIKNCHDGNCELLSDCGGPCPACPTCRDKIKNQGEKGIDCGGPCPACAIEIPYEKIKVGSIVLFAISALIVSVIIILTLLYYRKRKEQFFDKISRK